jgi:uncharacterized OB-fold protein
MPAPQYAREIPQRYRLEAARCVKCAKIAFPPRLVCAGCHGDAFEPVTLSDEGTLVTWTVIHIAPRPFAAEAPYVVGIVELEGGVRLTAQIVDCDASRLDFGARVRRVFRKLGSEGESGILRYGYKFVLANS